MILGTNKHCFVERLSLLNWVFKIFPFALRKKIKSISVFDAHPLLLRFAEKTGTCFGIKVEMLQFRLLDIKDENGLLIQLRISFQDLENLETELFDAVPLRFEENGNGNRFLSFLQKEILTGGLTEGTKDSLAHCIFLIHVCRWKIKEERSKEEPSALLFVDNRTGLEVLKRYASKYHINLFPLLQPVHFGWRKNHLLKYLYHLVFNWVWRIKYKAFSFQKRGALLLCQGPKIAIDYYGQLNIDHPEKYSDFFFYQQSEVKGDDLMAIFLAFRDPLDEEKLKIFQQHHIGVLPLHFKATQVASCPPLKPYWKPVFNGVSLRGEAWQHPDAKIFKKVFSEYQWLRAYWRRAFQEADAKIYLSWYKYDGSHMAIADAIRDLGGVMGIYQRALDVTSYMQCRLNVDLVFGYSKMVGDLEKKQKSEIRYFVVTGYLGDHRFSLLREQALRVRKEILRHGAKKIISFTDENSKDDRWHTGNQMMRDNYIFLLEKVLKYSWFGLVIKPKIPSTLRKRLGPVDELLRKAESTGRCHVYFERGPLHSAYPPAVAALSADVAIHGHLCAATAGFETALAGVPTLLLDKEGWTVSPLYDLGLGKVVFKDWDGLWEVCQEHWDSKGVPGFGDWSPMLDQLDPFRDGRAAERMGTYLKWMIEDFKTGCDRETVMANAAERYCRQWGQDKVISVN